MFLIYLYKWHSNFDPGVLTLTRQLQYTLLWEETLHNPINLQQISDMILKKVF